MERWGRVEGEGEMGMEKGQCAVLSHFDPLRRRGKGKRGERKGELVENSDGDKSDEYENNNILIMIIMIVRVIIIKTKHDFDNLNDNEDGDCYYDDNDDYDHRGYIGEYRIA